MMFSINFILRKFSDDFDEVDRFVLSQDIPASPDHAGGVHGAESLL